MRRGSLTLWLEPPLPRYRLSRDSPARRVPENWDELRPKGTFDVKGMIPEYDDPRVSLHQGWFEDTLPRFALPAHERLVIHIVADLYSSTKFVLDTPREVIVSGTVPVFDEFCDRLQEMKAFDEFLRTTGMTFSFSGGTANLEQVTFERVAYRLPRLWIKNEGVRGFESRSSRRISRPRRASSRRRRVTV